MKLTTRGHYSVKALLDLRLQGDREPASVQAIARRQGIPAPYLEKLLIELRQAGLVRSVRGARGGYLLARSPHLISLGEILRAVGESIEPLAQHKPDRDRAADWVAFSIWKRLSHQVQAALNQISLEDLYYDARSWQAAQGEEGNFTI